MIPLFLLFSIALTVNNHCSAINFHVSVGRINPEELGAAFTSHRSGIGGSSKQWACSIWDSTSALQLSSLSFGLSTLPF
jgi:hypothetical protein